MNQAAISLTCTTVSAAAMETSEEWISGRLNLNMADDS